MGVVGCGGGGCKVYNFTQYLHIFVSNALLITTITLTFDAYPNTKNGKLPVIFNSLMQMCV